MHPFANIVRCIQAYLEKHTNRTLARQCWLSLLWPLTLLREIIVASSRWWGERERSTCMIYRKGILQCVCVLKRDTQLLCVLLHKPSLTCQAATETQPAHCRSSYCFYSFRVCTDAKHAHMYEHPLNPCCSVKYIWNDPLVTIRWVAAAMSMSPKLNNLGIYPWEYF